MPLLQSEVFPVRTLAGRFQRVDAPAPSIYIPLGEGAELVERLRTGAGGRQLYRRLGQYGVSVYERHFAALNEAGELEVLKNNAVILLNTDLYSDETGLSLESDSGKALFV